MRNGVWKWLRDNEKQNTLTTNICTTWKPIIMTGQSPLSNNFKCLNREPLQKAHIIINLSNASIETCTVENSYLRWLLRQLNEPGLVLNETASRWTSSTNLDKARYQRCTCSMGMEKWLSRCGTLWLIRCSCPSMSKLKKQNRINIYPFKLHIVIFTYHITVDL